MLAWAEDMPASSRPRRSPLRSSPPDLAPVLSLRPKREFKQQRAAATYEALLRAATEVFTRRGFDAAQSPEIAALAGVSTGAFYRYFADKRQAFVEMMAAHLERAHAEVMAELVPARFTGEDPRGAIDVVLGVVFNHFRRYQGTYRVYLAMSLRDADVQALRAHFEAKSRETLVGLIKQVLPPGRVRDPQAAASVLQIAVLEAASEVLGLRTRATPELDEAAVRAELRELVYRYLLAPIADKPAPKKPAIRPAPAARR